MKTNTLYTSSTKLSILEAKPSGKVVIWSFCRIKLALDPVKFLVHRSATEGSWSMYHSFQTLLAVQANSLRVWMLLFVFLRLRLGSTLKLRVLLWFRRYRNGSKTVWAQVAWRKGHLQQSLYPSTERHSPTGFNVLLFERVSTVAYAAQLATVYALEWWFRFIALK